LISKGAFLTITKIFDFREASNLMESNILQGYFHAVEPWWQQIAIVILVAGILVSISVVGIAVWRIKD
jgi:hypothetical protein